MYQLIYEILLLCLIFYFNPIFSNQSTPSIENLRDPFNPPEKRCKVKKDKQIKLLGIISNGDKCGAVFDLNGEVDTVFLNDSIGGFKVLEIKTDHVILVKDKLKKKLFIE